jgi:hypothetical protein
VIAHVVLFRPRPNLTPADRAALLQAFADAARGIPSVRRARAGRRVFSGRAYEAGMAVDYAYAVVLEFDDMDGVEAYLDHPAHVELASRFFASCEAALVYDYDLRDAGSGLDDLLTP